VKTVERAIKFLKENGVIKIFHTKRSNGLNGNCYFVLQPLEGHMVLDDEEIVSMEEGNVGAGEALVSYGTPTLEAYQRQTLYKL
jgi:microcompartment protein CcmK/EutM